MLVVDIKKLEEMKNANEFSQNQNTLHDAFIKFLLASLK